MMNKIKNALLFIAGGIYASSFWLAFVINSNFFVFVLFGSVFVLSLVFSFFVDRWDDD